MIIICQSLKVKIVLVTFSVIIFLFISGTIINIFASINSQQESSRLALQLAIMHLCYSFPILFTWLCNIIWGTIIFVILGCGFVLLSIAKTSNLSYVFFVVYLVSLAIFLYWTHHRKKEVLVLNKLDIEHNLKECNILEKAFEEKNESR